MVNDLLLFINSLENRINGVHKIAKVKADNVNICDNMFQHLLCSNEERYYAGYLEALKDIKKFME